MKEDWISEIEFMDFFVVLALREHSYTHKSIKQD